MLTRPVIRFHPAGPSEIDSMFTAPEKEACQRLVDWALREDLDDTGDLTSQAIIPSDLQGRAVFRVHTVGVVAGLPAAELVFAALNTAVVFQPVLEDGATVQPGNCLAIVTGPMQAILAGERTALNFVQRLSGIACRARRYVEAVAGTGCQILDTRKTTPGWRLLEKYAVRCGGGANHRIGLYDAVLIKDNHLAALGGTHDAMRQAVQAARAQAPHGVTVTLEIDHLEQLDTALQAGPNVILLDNMKPEGLREAVARRNAIAPAIQLEASGGVNLTTVRELAASGIDRISVGELTHSAPALDIALDYEL
jgi:nicotinate-nucleotide pyrophosphorylase (carboxylating)